VNTTKSSDLLIW